MPELFTLPGPNRFVTNVVSAVRDGRGALVHVPYGAPVDLLTPAIALLDPEGYRCFALRESIDVPVQAIAWALCIEEHVARGDMARQLFAREEFKQAHVFLGEISADHWPAWDRFLQEFETIARPWDAFHRPRVVLQWKVRLGEQAPILETPLRAVRIWRGRRGELDLRVHVGTSLMSREISPIQRRLLTGMIVGLSLWDVDLADRLMELAPEELTDPLPHLMIYAGERGWTKSTEGAWELGTVDEFEGADQPHSAYAAIIEQNVIVKRRQWEAQAAVVLPLLDRARRELIEEGFVFFKRAFPGLHQDEDLFDAELGSLCHAISVNRGPDNLRRWAENLRWYRNELAHLRPVPFGSLYSYKGWSGS